MSKQKASHKPASIDLLKVQDALNKTGFVLEHQITLKFKAGGWNVINNRYYLDDVSEDAREIDLIAYKARMKKGVWYYTALIVSCKKSEENAWAFLSRDAHFPDPNVDWYPFKVWTNEEALDYYAKDLDWQSNFMSEAHHEDIFALLEPSGQLFGMQEIRKANHSVQNDKQMFGALSSLMKSQAYEMSTLRRRRKERALYSFHLLSVVDTEMIDVRYDISGCKATDVDDARWVFNYIVNKESTISRIHFVTIDGFDNVLPLYSALHESNYRYFSSLYNRFYDEIFSDQDRVDVFREEFQKRVLPVYEACVRSVDAEYRPGQIDFTWNDKENILELGACDTSKQVEALTKSSYAQRLTRRWLKELYHYDGLFRFTCLAIPF